MSQTPSPLGLVQLEQTLNAISVAIRKGDDYGERSLFGNNDYVDPHDDEIAKHYLHVAWSNLLALLEASGLSSLKDQAIRDYEDFKKDPLDSKMGYEEPYLVWPDKLRQFHDVITNLYMPPKDASSPVSQDLISILEKSEKYILSQLIFDWVPCCEADVHDRVEEMLGCVYTRIQRKPPIAKQIKNFVPDTGLPSIKTLVEYKFVASTEDAKRVVDEILADLGGYQSGNYKQFVFVIYETRRFSRLQDWEAVLTDSNPPTPTKVVLLKGVVPSEADKAKSIENRKRVAEVSKRLVKKNTKKTTKSSKKKTR